MELPATSDRRVYVHYSQEEESAMEILRLKAQSRSRMPHDVMTLGALVAWLKSTFGASDWLVYNRWREIPDGLVLSQEEQMQALPSDMELHVRVDQEVNIVGRKLYVHPKEEDEVSPQKLMRKTAFKRVPEGLDLLGSLLQWAQTTYGAVDVLLGSHWMEIGDPSELRRVLPAVFECHVRTSGSKKYKRSITWSENSGLQCVSTCVSTGKKAKALGFQGKTRKVTLAQLLGAENMDIPAAMQWLWLHLYGASEGLETYFSTKDEKRYYPYAAALLRAAAITTEKIPQDDRVQVFLADHGVSAIPDLQIIIDNETVIPSEVKVTWFYGSVDDPDGITRNAELLDKLLSYVLKFNKYKDHSYTCLTLVMIKVQFVMFFNFHISKASADDVGSLDLLEFAPGFSRGCGGHVATRGVPVLVDMTSATLDLGTFGRVLPTALPWGFQELVKYFRKVAPDVYAPLKFQYVDKLGVGSVSHVLSFGHKSCVLATQRNSVIKVSSNFFITRERNVHRWADVSDCIYLRKMRNYGEVLGAGDGLMFIELEGLGVTFAQKHVSIPGGLEKCWNAASQALTALHKQKLFHRDVKPSNFIVMDEGKSTEKMVLGDLDCAVQWEEEDKDIVGTPMFMSPLFQQLVGYKCRDDWLSLGLSMAFLMGLHHGKWPHGISGKRSLLVTLTKVPNVPQSLVSAIECALTREVVCCGSTD